ncbi:hypothetical protein BV25DRAFT_1875318 [Artomyces pyxidatus]|uniref:Uncharacterized protein n=1 Tax=Artomyces pyxidatus TaxID=48021 RepID=A0ACB8TI67_9AGAM|nr:hypothetical protein BV25DRAFT_1875318 [Artomyces pyxidatus]
MSVGYSTGLGIAIPQLPHAPAARASIALTGTTLHSADISAPSLFVPIAGVSHPSSSITLCPSRPVSNIKGPRPCLARPTEGFPPAGLGDDVRKTITRSGASRSRQFQPRPASLAPDVAAHVRDESGALCAVSNDAAIAPSLQRHGTLTSAGAPPSRKAAELKTLLGNANARLKPGAAVLPSGKVPQRLSRAKSERWVRKNADSVVLERAKSRARVEVDLALSGDTFVQGQLLSGQLTIRLRKCAKKEAPVLLSDAKLRIVGFESIPDEDHRHIFYQHSRRLEELSYASEQIFSDGPEDCDAEGYRQGREGVHSIHFEMDLPVNTAGGNAKGDVNLHGCVAIRYIVMISVKVKDADSSKRSLAHFYRSCSIWPQLSLQAILAPAPRPLVSTAAKSLFFSGKYNKLKLTARLSRLTYLAGQRCYVQIHIANDTRRAVRGVTLVLVRTTTVYIPRPDAGRDTSENAYQVNTIVREVAESRLELGERATKGHASAKGWWTGVDANEETEFFHFILLPPDALSIARSRLIAIDYTVRVTITASTGAPGFNSELSVILPVRIASMLSVDPPPSLCLPNEALTINRYCKTLEMPRYMRTNRVDDTRAGTLPPYRTQPPSLVDYEVRVI